MKLGEFTTKYISTIPTIADCHAMRLGWGRTLAGGFSMYLSIPVWLLFHLTTSTSLYHFFLRPILRLDKVSIGDYVVLDRHTIKGMSLADRLNCNFCGYANGITTMMNDQIDKLSQKEFYINYLQIIPLQFVAFLFTFISLIGDLLAIGLVYNGMVAPLLDMKKTNFLMTIKQLNNKDYAKNFNYLARLIIIYNKSVFIRLSELLAQIESSWCPIKHLKRAQSVIYPEHHENFFEPEEFDQMKNEIVRKGSTLK